MATHSSILAWRIPWTEESGGLQSTGSQSQTRLSDSAQHRGWWGQDLWICRVWSHHINGCDDGMVRVIFWNPAWLLRLRQTGTGWGRGGGKLEGREVGLSHRKAKLSAASRRALLPLLPFGFGQRVGSLRYPSTFHALWSVDVQLLQVGRRKGREAAWSLSTLLSLSLPFLLTPSQVNSVAAARHRDNLLTFLSSFAY